MKFNEPTHTLLYHFSINFNVGRFRPPALSSLFNDELSNFLDIGVLSDALIKDGYLDNVRVRPAGWGMLTLLNESGPSDSLDAKMTLAGSLVSTIVNRSPKIQSVYAGWLFYNEMILPIDERDWLKKQKEQCPECCCFHCTTDGLNWLSQHSSEVIYHTSSIEELEVLVRFLPLSLLPEWLAHPNDRIRAAAAKKINVK